MSNAKRPHILGLCETFLHDDIANEHVCINNFVLERKDRKGKKGGGLVIYVHESQKYKRRIDIEVHDIESVWLEIFYNQGNSFLLNFAYRPPNSHQSWIDLYEEQIDIADCTNREFFLLGDYNINYICADTRENYNNNKWQNMVTQFGLNQLIRHPTRVTKRSASIIDHIYTTCKNKVESAFVSTLAISDHYPICLTFSNSVILKSDSHKSIKYRSFKKFDIQSFQKGLLSSGLECVEMCTDPNNALCLLYDCINVTLSSHAPLKEKRIKRDQQPNWFTNEIKSYIRDRDYHKQNGNFDKYKILRNKIRTLIKRSKRDFFNKAIKENKDSKFIWKNLKQEGNLHTKNNMIIPEKIVRGGKEIDDKLDIVNELNRHFVNISNIVNKMEFAEETFSSLKSKLDSVLQNATFEIKYITPLEVKNIIDKLNINKSTGIDGIGPMILKHCGDTITQSISAIINNSISLGIFPDKLKEARVIPIFKSGIKEDVENYRPISILPTLSKIFERHIAEQIHQYFKETDIIHKTQSGFRKDHSCHTALIRLIDNWVTDIDSGKLVGAVFLDLRKAFDLVDHKILIHKLKLYHFSDRTVDLFKSYLSNRHQTVIVKNVKSNNLTMKSGVPQGSIIGPLLFLLYINDIAFSCNNLNLDLYADDSTMFESGLKLTDIQPNLQINLNNISQWCTFNNMSLHPKKTKCMLIGSRHKIKNTGQLTLRVNETYLENVSVQKILGVFIDNTLSWQTHIDYVCKRVNMKIALLKRMLFYINDDMKRLFYNSYILPLFDYCCTVWGKDNNRSINKIYQLQKRVAKIILNKPVRSSSMGLFKELKWLSFSDRCKYHCAVLVFKSLNNMAPPYLSEMLTFSMNEKYSLRSTKHKDLIVKIKPRTNSMKYTFSYYSMNVWNNIPTHIRSAISLNAFKSNYKCLLSDNAVK